jgi:NAD(P)-dependent dehydrogenase (short-subunit alcohol dehydrogenase family)
MDLQLADKTVLVAGAGQGLGQDAAFAAVALRAQSALPSYGETAQPVLAGAVGDALGVAVDRLPITPNRLWELMS